MKAICSIVSALFWLLCQDPCVQALDNGLARTPPMVSTGLALSSWPCCSRQLLV